MTRATNEQVKAVHLMFQSTGGTVNDGVALYNFFRTFPLELHIYNVGAVQSIAVLAYVGVQHRHVSAHGTFFMHLTGAPVQPGSTATQLKTAMASLVADDRRTEAIMRAHAKIPRQKWTQLKRGDLVFNAQEALQYGIADDVREFVVPQGNEIFNV